MNVRPGIARLRLIGNMIGMVIWGMMCQRIAKNVATIHLIVKIAFSKNQNIV